MHAHAQHRKTNDAQDKKKRAHRESEERRDISHTVKRALRRRAGAVSKSRQDEYGREKRNIQKK